MSGNAAGVPDVAVDASGDINYIGGVSALVVHQRTVNGSVSTFAGCGRGSTPSGLDGSPALKATLNGPQRLALVPRVWPSRRSVGGSRAVD